MHFQGPEFCLKINFSTGLTVFKRLMLKIVSACAQIVYWYNKGVQCVTLTPCVIRLAIDCVVSLLQTCMTDTTMKTDDASTRWDLSRSDGTNKGVWLLIRHAMLVFRWTLTVSDSCMCPTQASTQGYLVVTPCTDHHSVGHYLSELSGLCTYTHG